MGSSDAVRCCYLQKEIFSKRSWKALYDRDVLINYIQASEYFVGSIRRGDDEPDKGERGAKSFQRNSLRGGVEPYWQGLAGGIFLEDL